MFGSDIVDKTQISLISSRIYKKHSILMLMKMEKNFFGISFVDLAIASFLFLFSLALYIRTLAPTVLSADAAEFQALAYTMGMTHPSGYSTYVFFGKIFTLIPVGSIAYRVNLMSAFFGALAAGQAYLIIQLMLDERLAGVAGSIALALHPLFWQRTIFAETYAPAAAMITSIWLMMLLWRNNKDARYLFVAGLLGGLSVGIHSTVVMTSVSVLVYMLFKARQRGDWVYAALGAFLGLLLTFLAFLYLDYNNPPSSIYNTSYLTNLSVRGLTPEDFDSPMDRLFAIFPAKSFWTYYFSAETEVIRFRLSEFLGFYPRWQVGLIFLGAIALFFMKKEKQSLLPDALYVTLSFLLVWGFAITVSFSVYKEFYVLASIFINIWLGIGIGLILKSTQYFLVKKKITETSSMRIAKNLIGIGFVIVILLNSRTDIDFAFRHGCTTFIQKEGIYPCYQPDRYIRLADKVLNKVEDDAIVFAVWDRLYTYVYRAHIEQGRTTISFHEAWPQLGQSTLDYIALNIDERPIYFATNHPEISSYYKLEQVGGNLYRLRKKD